MIKQAERHFHRVLGTFLMGLVIEHNLDGIVLRRRDLLNFLDMRHLKAARLDSLLEDVKDLFPERSLTSWGNARIGRSAITGRIWLKRPVKAELWLCRRPFNLPAGTMDSIPRAQRLFHDSGVKFGVLDMRYRSKPGFRERIKLTFDLALSTQLAASLGQRLPQEDPNHPDERRQFDVIVPKTSPVAATAVTA